MNVRVLDEHWKSTKLARDLHTLLSHVSEAPSIDDSFYNPDLVACLFRLSAQSRTFCSHPTLVSCPDAGIESMIARASCISIGVLNCNLPSTRLLIARVGVSFCLLVDAVVATEVSIMAP